MNDSVDRNRYNLVAHATGTDKVNLISVTQAALAMAANGRASNPKQIRQD
jgi:hypothetical protein